MTVLEDIMMIMIVVDIIVIIDIIAVLEDMIHVIILEIVIIEDIMMIDVVLEEIVVVKMIEDNFYWYYITCLIATNISCNFQLILFILQS